MQETKKGPGAKTGRGAKGKKQDVILYPRPKAAIVDPHEILICVDDTDDVTGTTSTGFVAERIADKAVSLGAQITLGVTRHQLLLDDAVEYTSHNSAMCLALEISAAQIDALREAAVQVLIKESVADADPGICIADITTAKAEGAAAYQNALAKLIAFGHRAQTQVCTKDEAYALAGAFDWLELSEHGGSGIGVIGALAGVGLRLSQNDGRFRGKWNLPKILGVTQDTLSAAELCKELSERASGAVVLVDSAGGALADDVPVYLGEEVKPIYRFGALCIVANFKDGVAIPSEKIDLGNIGNGAGWDQVCEKFEIDNDLEECASATPTCRNCLYRRNTANGFKCIA
jgi:hypothetical protein